MPTKEVKSQDGGNGFPASGYHQPTSKLMAQRRNPKRNQDDWAQGHLQPMTLNQAPVTCGQKQKKKKKKSLTLPIDFNQNTKLNTSG